MSWFNASQLSSFAKQALSQAQKSIDRVLDIQEEEPSAWAEAIPYGEPGKRVPGCRSCLPSDPCSACCGPSAGPADLWCHLELWSWPQALPTESGRSTPSDP